MPKTAPIFKNGVITPNETPGLGIELKNWIKLLLDEKIKIVHQ